MAEASRPPAPIAVISWLLRGANEQQISEALRAEYPRARHDATMAAVQEHLAAAGQPDPDAVRGWALLSLRQLYQKQLEAGDFDGCRKSISEIIKIVR